jgi:hypothetical protein
VGFKFLQVAAVATGKCQCKLSWRADSDSGVFTVLP